MPRLVFQNLVIYGNKNLPNFIKNITKVDKNFAKDLIKPQKLPIG